MGNAGEHGNAGRRLGLRIAIAAVALLLAAVATRAISAQRAYARAEAFCAATTPGATARDVTIRALDQSVQVRTDIEPGALVVRFQAWGFAPAAGECHMRLDGDSVVATQVVRVDHN